MLDHLSDHLSASTLAALKQHLSEEKQVDSAPLAEREARMFSSVPSRDVPLLRLGAPEAHRGGGMV